jgi:RNA recognition motif-containing protein
MLLSPSLQPPHLRVKKIFVGGLKPDTSDDKIRDYFGKYAPVSMHAILVYCMGGTRQKGLRRQLYDIL